MERFFPIPQTQRGSKDISMCVRCLPGDPVGCAVGMDRNKFVALLDSRHELHSVQNFPKEKMAFASQLKQIWLQPDKESAFKITNPLIVDYKKRFPE